MPPSELGPASLDDLDDATRALVRMSAIVAAGNEGDIRGAMSTATSEIPVVWVEELLLQSYLFAGFPRALNGMRAWRRVAGPASHQLEPPPCEATHATGERVCARVYGSMYDRLRLNVRELHPLLDDWMISEGYGKVLSRPQLDLPRRELCIMAACAATGQDRQLQSHLHGARNVGVTEPVIAEALQALSALVPAELLERATRLWDRIRHDVH